MATVIAFGTMPNQRDRLLMTSVGSFTLGDRDDGEIRFENTKVFVGGSRYREQDATILIDRER